MAVFYRRVLLRKPESRMISKLLPQLGQSPSARKNRCNDNGERQ